MHGVRYAPNMPAEIWAKQASSSGEHNASKIGTLCRKTIHNQHNIIGNLFDTHFTVHRDNNWLYTQLTRPDPLPNNKAHITIGLISDGRACMHSKNVFVTLIYSLSFEMHHDGMQMFSYLLHRIPTHTNGSKAIIMALYQAVVIRGIRYVVCGQVQIATNLICLHALSSANEINDALMVTMVCYNGMYSAITTIHMVCYYDIAVSRGVTSI